MVDRMSKLPNQNQPEPVHAIDGPDHTFPGGTTNFLREDGTFATPGGGGGLTQAYLGYNTVGGSTETPGAKVVYAKKISPANSCLLASVEMYLAFTADVARDMMVLFYDDNGSGTAPKHLLWADRRDALVLELSGTGPRDARWFGINCNGLWLTGGVDYWIAFCPDLSNGSSVQIYYDSGGDVTMTPTTAGQSGDWGLWTTGGGTRKYSMRANTIR